METTTEETFKAVPFMRKVREELSELYQKDPEQYLKQVRQAMDDFLERRGKFASSGALPQEKPTPAN